MSVIRKKLWNDCVCSFIIFQKPVIKLVSLWPPLFQESAASVGRDKKLEVVSMSPGVLQRVAVTELVTRLVPVYGYRNVTGPWAHPDITLSPWQDPDTRDRPWKHKYTTEKVPRTSPVTGRWQAPDTWEIPQDHRTGHDIDSSDSHDVVTHSSSGGRNNHNEMWVEEVPMIMYCI